MRLDDQPAYVLHARPWRETSLLVEVLTQEHGRLGLLARGVQGPKKQALRAALQPLQSIRFDAVLAGELAQLRRAESQDAAPRLHGQAMLAGFCVNCPESPDTVIDDRREVGTTYAFAPPRVFENMLTVTMVRMEDAGALKRKMFHYFLDVAKRYGEQILNGESVPLKDTCELPVSSVLSENDWRIRRYGASISTYSA